MKLQKKIGIGALVFSGLLAILIEASTAAGLRINVTASAPRGLWLSTAYKNHLLVRGDIIEMCAPQVPIVKIMAENEGMGHSNKCPGKTEPLLKPVAAVAGDTVEVTAGKDIKVNGGAIPNSAALKRLPGVGDGKYVVKPGEVWVISTYDHRSFDSRYFGAVKIKNILAKAKPLIVGGNVNDMTQGYKKW